MCIQIFWDDHPPKTLEQLNKQDLDLHGHDAWKKFQKYILPIGGEKW